MATSSHTSAKALALAALLSLAAPFAPASPTINDNDAGSGTDAADTQGNATPLGVGQHSGRVLFGADTSDFYTFTADPDECVEITFQAPPRAAAWVHNPDGARTRLDSFRWRGFTSAETGPWFIEVVDGVPDSPLSPSSAYQLGLGIAKRPVQDDAGTGADVGSNRSSAIPLGEGPHSGTLDACDPADVYRVTVPASGSIIQVTPSPGLLAYGRLRDAAGKPVPMTSPGERYLEVYRSAGHGAYSVEIASPTAPFRAIEAPRWTAGGIAADALGAYVVADRSVLRLTDSGPETLFPVDVTSARDLDMTSDGSFVFRSLDLTLRKHGASGSEPVTVRNALTSAFGPDDALSMAVVDSRGFAIERIEADRTTTRVASSRDWVDQLVWSPQGELYAVVTSPYERAWIKHLDLVHGTWTNVTPAQAFAFDSAGRMYTASWSMDSTIVSVYDPSTQESVAIGVVPGYVGRLASSGTRLYATISYRYWGPVPDGPSVGYFDTGVLGFEGFRPEFALAPAPDLAITSMRVEREPPLATVGDSTVPNEANEVRTVVVEVTNVGAGPALAATDVELIESPSPILAMATRAASGNYWRQDLPALAPGESVELRFPQDMTKRAGELRFQAWVDWAQLVAETEERSNNIAEVTTTVRLSEPV